MAVLLAGMEFENRAMEEQSGKRQSSKQPRRKENYQSIHNSRLTSGGVRKMQVPEDGIW